MKVIFTIFDTNFYNIFGIVHNNSGDHMKKKTLWQEGIEPLSDTKIDYKEKDVDILIIGGGIAGITALYQLSKTKKNVLLIDKDKIGFGVTSNTTGKLTYLQDQIYEQIIDTYDTNTALSYLQAQRDAIAFVKQTVQREKIDCNFEEVDSYVFATKEEQIKKIDTLQSFLDLTEVKYESMDNIPIDIPSLKALKVPHTAVFHPVKYLYELARISLSKGVKIMENVRATDIDQDGSFYITHTNAGKIRSKKVLICTHYPFFIRPGWVPFKSHIESSYVVATPIEDTKPFSAITMSNPIYSIRYHQDKQNYLLFASGSDKTTKCKSKKEYYEKTSERFESFFHMKPSYAWSTHDIIPNDHLPLIGPISKKHPNVMIATGFQKWGMTNGTIAGIILSELATDKHHPYEGLFLPYRPYNLKRCIQTVKDGIDSVGAMIRSTFQSPKGQAKIEVRDGKRVGIYIDPKGREHIVSIICPHMKCHLLFNEVDCTWDCPCHGSRFDIDGNLLEGPSVLNIDQKK